MKNEDKVVELLAESLKKQDQMIEKQGIQENILSQMIEELKQMKSGIKDMRSDVNQVTFAVNALADIVKIWMEKTKGIDDLKDRVTRLEKHTGL